MGGSVGHIIYGERIVTTQCFGAQLSVAEICEAVPDARMTREGINSAWSTGGVLSHLQFALSAERLAPTTKTASSTKTVRKTSEQRTDTLALEWV